MSDGDGEKPKVARRAVEESLGDMLTRSIDTFVFRDIEDEDAATAVFEFIDDHDARTMLGRALRGARWMQKAGLVLAREQDHPARPTLLRAQLVDYGAIVELVLREALRQQHATAIPTKLHELIALAAEHELLSTKAVDAADRRRQVRNDVHFAIGAEVRTSTDAAKALKDTALIINELRAHAGLEPWQPKRAEPRS